MKNTGDNISEKLSVALADPVNMDGTHSAFNALLSNILKESNELNVECLFFAEQSSSIRDILEKDTKNAITFKDFNFFDKQMKKLGIFIATLRSFRYAIELKKMPFFLAVDNLWFPLLCGYYGRRRKVEIIAVLHNNFENIKKSLLKKTLWKFANASSAQFIVLAETLKVFGEEELKLDNLNLVRHPTYSSLNNEAEEHCKIYDLLLIGRHSNPIAVSEFFSILARMDIQLNKPVKIVVVCSQEIFMQEIKNMVAPPQVELELISGRLNQREYWKLLGQSKAVYIGEEARNRMTASGVCADAITCSSILVAPRSQIFVESLPRTVHAYLYENDNRVTEIIADILAMSEDEFHIIAKELQRERNSTGARETSINIMNIIMKSKDENL